jgi:hypothetical protein
VSYYYTKSLFNKEWNSNLFIKYYLNLYLIKNILLVITDLEMLKVLITRLLKQELNKLIKKIKLVEL